MKGKTFKVFLALLMAAVMITASGCTMTGGETVRPGRSGDTFSAEAVSEEGEGSNDDNSLSVENLSIDTTKMYVTGINEKIAMRESDEENAAIIAQLKLKEEVEVLDDSSETCYYVDANGTKGYIKKEYLTEEKNAVCKRIDAYITKKTSLYNTNESDHSEVISLSKNNGIFIVAKTSGDYWYVYAKGSKVFGYVNSMDISTSKVQDTSSTVSVAPAPNPNPTPSNSYPTGYGSAPASYEIYYAKVDKNYLAIRSAKSYDAYNELGKMYTGDTVYVIDKSTGTYWYCYSPTLGIRGYVNSEFLVSYYPGSGNSGSSSSGYTVWTVSGAGTGTHYLALRSAKAFDPSNEIGKLYDGDKVRVYSYSYTNFTDVYWYVYSPKLGMWGYVNSNYIYDNI